MSRNSNSDGVNKKIILLIIINTNNNIDYSITSAWFPGTSVSV